MIYERIRQSLFSAVSALTIVDSMPDGGNAAIILLKENVLPAPSWTVPGDWIYDGSPFYYAESNNNKNMIFFVGKHNLWPNKNSENILNTLSPADRGVSISTDVELKQFYP